MNQPWTVASLLLISLSAPALADGPATKAQLRVIVRASSDLDAAGGAKSLVASPIAGDLWSVVVVDSPAHARMLRRDELSAPGLDAASALSVALSNVEKDIGPLSRRLRLPLPAHSIGMLTPPHEYGGASVASPHAWGEAAHSMKARLLVSVPSNQVVLYVEATDSQRVAVLKALTARAFADADRPVSKVVLEWSQTGWKALP